MSLTIKAAVDNKKHLEIVKDYKNETINLFFNNEMLESCDLYDFLFSELSKYEKLNIDFQSFVDCKFVQFNAETLNLIISSIVAHYNNFPLSLKTIKKSQKSLKIIYPNANNSSEINDLIESEIICKNLQELPPNLLKPDNFVAKTQELLKDSGFEIEILNFASLKEKNLNLICSVGQSTENAYLIVIKSLNNDVDKNSIALIGKGVCYDTGGLNIKTGNYMNNMKFDMSGAAVILSLANAWKKHICDKNIYFLIPLVENLINAKSYKADDVIISHSGLSVEITNTDAEGRLILADAISYAARNLKVSRIITIATLTGAIGYALGYKYSGVWSTCEKMWKKLNHSSMLAGEWIWRMPLNNYYLKALDSPIADIANSAKVGAGGASRAAMFLKEFTNKIPYVHLDIANTAHLENKAIATAPLLKTLFYYLTK